MKIHDDIVYISPGRARLKTPEELFLKDSQNRELVAPEKNVLTKTVELVLSSILR